MPDFGNFNPKLLVWNDGLGDVTVEELGPHSWRLLQPFSYTFPDGKTVQIERGFVTDGASSPFRELISSWGGRYSTAALIHDCLYDDLNHGRPQEIAPTRADADFRFRWAMELCHVNATVSWLMWLAVRAFGGPGMRDLGVR